ncbi:MAG: VapE domain-containing protein [Pseudomonadota bacterium]
MTCIHPERGQGIETRTFTDADEVRDWIVRWNTSRNCYYTLNPLTKAMSKKPERIDLAAVTHLHLDDDPRAGEDRDEERARILCRIRSHVEDGDVPPPSFVVDSGNGYQCVWRLAQPIELDGTIDTADSAADYNRGIEQLFDGSDKCHNVDRLLRLPGTINWPDEKKRAKGRIPVLASVVEQHAGEYHLNQFPPPSASPTAPPGASPRAPTTSVGEADFRRIESLDDLDQYNVPDDVKLLIVEGPNEKHPSRSEAVWRVLCGMVRTGVPDEIILGVMTDPDWRISERPRQHGVKALIRELTNAHETVNNAFERYQGKNGVDGAIKRTYANNRLAVLKLGLSPKFDEFRHRLTLQGHQLSDDVIRLDDRVLSHLRQLVLDTFGYDPGKDMLDDAVRQLCYENSFDPVRDYLDSLQWDGTSRLNTWLHDYLSAEDNDYTQAVGALTLIGAVRRARTPGCKFDTILVLEGDQGVGKSSAVRILASDDFFSDEDIMGCDTKERIELLQGVWLQELSELEGMGKREVAAVKAATSRQVDRARLAFGKHTTEAPRRCIFIGTCNENQYLRDPTGNRRFLPVTVGQVDFVGLHDVRDQLWAEAAVREAEGASTVLDSRLWQVAAAEALERVVDDPWQDVLRDLNDPYSKVFQEHVYVNEALMDLRLKSSSVLEIVGVTVDRRNPSYGQRAVTLMRSLGWEKPRNNIRFPDGYSGKGYRKDIDVTALRVIAEAKGHAQSQARLGL